MSKRVLILGSTGSIGVQTIDVIESTPDLEVCGIAAGGNRRLVEDQARAAGGVPTALRDGGGTVACDRGFARLIDEAVPDIVLNAIVGAAGLESTLAALERGVDVALANKESLVVGGDLVRECRERTGAALLPVDSEHSAAFQLLEGRDRDRVRSVVLTASGGPFRGRTREQLAAVTPGQALRHPTWTMGAKITIDSATLMNKGLEVIEARHLFDLADDRVEVVVHPQSLIHAMIRLDDGSVLAHCAPADMRVPIAYALMYPAPPPERPAIDMIGQVFEFDAPDLDAFPCLELAREAGRAGGTAPAVLNAANEVAVAEFLAERIGFMDIPALVGRALDEIGSVPADSVETVLDADRRARTVVSNAVGVGA